MKFRSTARTAAVVLAALVSLIIVAAIVVVLLPRPGGTGPCTPANSRQCSCLSESAELAGVTPSDHRTLAPEQREFQEFSFVHDGTESTYRVFSHGIDWDRPVGAVVRLHGDGAYEYLYSRSLSSCLAAVAATHNLILVQPLTPAADLTWWKELDTNTAWLEALHVEEIAGLDGVDPDNVWWMGYSGGAEMISYGLLPSAGSVVTGGAIMVGGGGASAHGGHSVPADRTEDLPLHWATGRRDTGEDPREPFDALSAATGGADFYRAAGFGSVTTDFQRDDDHFTIDQVEILQSVLQQH